MGCAALSSARSCETAYHILTGACAPGRRDGGRASDNNKAKDKTKADFRVTVPLKWGEVTRGYQSCSTLLNLGKFWSSGQPRATLMVQVVKNLPAKQQTQEMWVQSLGQEDPMEKGMAIHSNILAWKIPWQRRLVGYCSWGHKRVGHDWARNGWDGGWADLSNMCWPFLPLLLFGPSPWTQLSNLMGTYPCVSWMLQWSCSYDRVI